MLTLRDRAIDLVGLMTTPLLPADYLDMVSPLRAGRRGSSRATRDRDAPRGWAGHVPGRLLDLDLVDDLRLALVPVLVGGGLRLFPDGVAARFHPTGVAALEHGAIGLHLRRG